MDIQFTIDVTDEQAVRYAIQSLEKFIVRESVAPIGFIARTEVIAEVIDGDEATTFTQAAEAVVAATKVPKETTKQRARRKTTARTETVVDKAQIEIEPAAKVIDLMDALKQSLAVAPPPTEEAVFEAVKSLAARKGVPKVHEVFAGFAIKKAGEIAVEKRGELIAALESAS